MKKVKISIDGIETEVSEDVTIYEAAKQIGINIPIFCYHPEIKEKIGACRICLVEVEGIEDPVPSCSTPVKDGMVIKTNTPKIREIRKFVLEMLKSIHKSDCLHCIRSQTCQFLEMSYNYGLYEDIHFEVKPNKLEEDESAPGVIMDPEKCIYCGRCESVCSIMQTVDVLGHYFRGKKLEIAPALNLPLKDTPCIQCGQCILACPVGAIHEKDETNHVWKWLSDPEFILVAQTAPAVRVALGEEFGMLPGEIVTGKMVSALKRIGFDYVFDTQFGADLTIVEECNEVVERLKKKKNLPVFTSCCPAWVQFVKEFYPDMVKNISTAKSPQSMVGGMTKTYFAQKLGVPPEKIKVVSIMPCTAKKMEITWEEQLIEIDGKVMRPVDAALTTREISRMFKQAGINFHKISEEFFDSPFSISSGAGAIFGGSGGVMEAALRYAYELITGKELKKIIFEQVRGLDRLKIADVAINGIKLKVAVASSLSAARSVLEMYRRGEIPELAFIEVMACPGGCLAGGGQPIPTDEEIRQKRLEAIYLEDRIMTIKKSQDNPQVMRLYQEFLGKPGSEVARKYLHIHFHPEFQYPTLENVNEI